MNKNYTIAVLGSHSALDVCRGAKDLRFKTLVIFEFAWKKNKLFLRKKRKKHNQK